MNYKKLRKQIGLLTTVSFSALLLFSCSNDKDNPEGTKPAKVWSCSISGDTPDFSHTIGCNGDFTALASEPLDASIPGASSAKTVIDLWDDENGQPLYITNSKKYQVHFDFVSKKLSSITNVTDFNNTEYYSPNRQYVLGAITYYSGPHKWAYEIAPYDNATADMITKAYQKIADSCYFGDSLYFHPTSQAIEVVAKKLPSSVKIVTTDELYSGIDYQPLNLATGMGRLVFITAKELDTSYVGFRDIVVLDAVPNDISVTSGIITQMFQTPLAHINVLSHNRGTPNMALKNACTNPALLALKGKWVKLVVGSFDYSVTEVTKEEADAWWDSHKPATVGIAKMDTVTKDLRDAKDILDYPNKSLGDAIHEAIPAFGGKASHFGGFPHMDSTKVPYPKAFAIPVYWYWHFMEMNGFNAQVKEMLADPQFQSDPAVRDKRLAALRDSIMDAPLDSAFEEMLFAKLATDFQGTTVRFRSSTNAEDLDGFTGAGLYTSKTGDPTKKKSVRNAIREVYSSVWFFRAFEERSYRSIDHLSVGMALLVHRTFPDEEATGVAISSNPFETSGLEPGFYVNVQAGDNSVVLPDSTVTTDQFICNYTMPGQPITYMAHSNQIPTGTTVLTNAQVYKLGAALQEIHNFWKPLYGASGGWFAMDTEFKFDQTIDNPNGEPVLFMKQARPYSGSGTDISDGD